MPAAVLWDMDGTLIDTEPYWFAEERALVERHGGRWDDDDSTALIGSDLLDAAAIIRERAGITLGPQQIVSTMLDGVAQRLRGHVPWRPGAARLLAELQERDVRCALVTMSWSSLAEVFLAAAPAGSFAVVVTGDQVARGKPHPEPYLTAAAALGVAPGACVAIEDSPTGVRSAEAAGVPTLAVPHLVDIAAAAGRSRVSSLADLRVADLGRIAAGHPLDLIC